MKLEPKEQLIIDFLKDKAVASVEDIVKFTNLSAATIRRYLIKLSAKQIVSRVHGGASLNRALIESPSINHKITINHKQKVAIAKQAVSLIEKKDCIALDAGSTTIEIAKLINMPVHIITPDLNIGLVLSKNQDIDVALTGGKVDWSGQACVGTHSLSFIDKIHPTYTFIGCNGWSITHGITTPTSEKASLKAALLKQSKIKVLVADSSKYDKSQLYEVCPLTDLDIIITDEALDKEIAQKIIELGVKLYICKL